MKRTQSDLEVEVLSEHFWPNQYSRVIFTGPMASIVAGAAETERANFEKAVSWLVAGLLRWFVAPPELKPLAGMPVSLSAASYVRRQGTAGNRHITYRAMRSAYEWLLENEFIELSQRGYKLSSGKKSNTHIIPKAKLLTLLDVIEED